MKLPKYNLSYNTWDLIHSLAKSTCERKYEKISYTKSTAHRELEYGKSMATLRNARKVDGRPEETCCIKVPVLMAPE